ncbi:hypothetical protein BCF44_1229 [Kutzneria buriramensis]|uniref:Uncharacterized protein n=1 Tax=Kutzneria buriramensis TaxID=1045776 RepID=A0A3E0GWP2_9PSEU|nr:hypothetical protein BCF44_1229 [Kutzneria buriramensis]
MVMTTEVANAMSTSTVDAVLPAGVVDNSVLLQRDLMWDRTEWRGSGQCKGAVRDQQGKAAELVGRRGVLGAGGDQHQHVQAAGARSAGSAGDGARGSATLTSMPIRGPTRSMRLAGVRLTSRVAA